MKIKKKSSIAILASLFLATSIFLSGCGSQGESKSTQAGGEASSPKTAQNYTLKLANYFGADHPQNIAMRERFKPIVEEKSGGTLKVQIFENSKLGGEKEFYDGIRTGTIEMGIVGTIMSGDVEKMSVGDWPFLFKDIEHAKKVFTGPLGEEIAADLEKQAGVKVLAWSANGFRMFSSNKPIQGIEDFKGLRLRMPNIPNYLKMAGALGANVTPMPISEVFTALEQKVVDGQDNPIATLKANGWYEVQSDVLESNHVFNPNLYIINGKLWEKLTPEQQTVLKEAAIEAANYEWELYANSFEADKKFLEEHGVTFTTPDDKFRSDLEAAMQPFYEETFKQYPWAKDMIEKIKQAAE